MLRRHQQKQMLVGKHCAQFLHTSPLFPVTPGGPWETNWKKVCFNTSNRESWCTVTIEMGRGSSYLVSFDSNIAGHSGIALVTEDHGKCERSDTAVFNTTAKTPLVLTSLPFGPIGPIAPCTKTHETRPNDQLGASLLILHVVKLMEGRFRESTWSPLYPMWPFNPFAPVSPLSPLSPWE